VRVYLKPKSTDEIGKQFVSDVNEQRLWDRKNQTPATLLQIWRRVINDPELWTDIPEDGSTRVVKIAVKQEIIQDFTCDHDGLAHEIGHLEFDAELSVAPSAMLMVE